MLFRDEIKKLEESLMAQCSLREKLFYGYLTGNQLKERIEVPDTPIEKICLASFNDIAIDISKDLARLLKTNPVKGMHFSNNLIILIGVSLKSSEARAKFLPSYFESATLIEKFIIVKIFNEFNLHDNINIKTNLDRLIDEVFIKHNYQKGEELLLPAFEEVTDLIGLLIIRYAYEEIIRIHPNTELQMKMYDLSINLQKFILATKKRLDKYVVISIISIGILVMIGTIAITISKWEEWHLEIFWSVFPFIIAIITGLAVVAYNSEPNWLKFICEFKRKLLIKYFKNRQLDISKLEEMLTPRQDTSE